MITQETSSSFVDLLKDGMSLSDLNADVRIFADGDTIFQEGDPGDGLYVIKEGRVRITAVVGQAAHQRIGAAARRARGSGVQVLESSA